MPEDRKSYVILRLDGLLLHTKPITWEEMVWLKDAYSERFLSREARARYLAEYGNVLDVGEYLERLRRLPEPNLRLLSYRVVGTYGDPERLTGLLAWLLGRGDLSPEARQTVKELLNRIEDFLREPVEPKPIEEAPVRYFELPRRHVKLGLDGNVYGVEPRPEWYAYHSYGSPGISIFMDSLWLWAQHAYTYVVAVRRDAGDEEVVAALANDGAAQGFLKEYADAFRELLRQHEKELTDRGYGDVVGKTKMILAIAELMAAGRRREGEEEGVPA